MFVNSLFILRPLSLWSVYIINQLFVWICKLNLSLHCAKGTGRQKLLQYEAPTSMVRSFEAATWKEKAIRLEDPLEHEW